jgi:HPt (histidine-containing phosphotransfer) domain-containing protein
MDNAAVLDLSEALNRADGDRDLFLTLVTIFLEESPKEAGAARAAIGQQDRAGLVAAAHKLKGSVIEMCAPQLFESARRLEQLGREGKFVEAASACSEVEMRLTEVHAALRNVMAGGFPS